MMNQILIEYIDKWVSVVYGDPMSGMSAGANYTYGVLVTADEAAVLVRQPDGEILFIPMSSVRRVGLIEPPELGPGGTLLRPSTVPVEPGMLMRPAGAGSDIVP